MTKVNGSSLIKLVGNGFKKRSAEILTGFGIAGMITAIIFAVKATPKAMDKIEEKKEEKGEDLTKVEVIRASWKYYIPTGIAFLTAMTCIIGSDAVNARRNAALTAACTISETALQEYQNKVVETIGEKKEQAIQDDICKDHVSKQSFDDDDYFETGMGTTRCWDRFCGRPFWGDAENIRKAVNSLNQRLISENYISLNDFYYELGMPESSLGDLLGWKIEDGLIDIGFSSQLDSKNRPCLVVYYKAAPKYDYDKL